VPERVARKPLAFGSAAGLRSAGGGASYRKDWPMSDDPKALLQRFYEGVSAGDLSVIDELVADDFVDHEDFPGIPSNKQGVTQFFELFRSSFPDLRMTAHEVVAEGDLLCVRGTMSGTHEGEFMGIPPTHKHFEVEGFDMVRFRDGLVTEHWGVFDSMAMMQQLGAIPEPASA
jgi:steroid delta-isomerase-like uncharacterized protein